MKQKITTLRKPAMTVIGIECRTSNASDAAPRDIPKLWQKFYENDVLSKISNKASEEVIALYCDYEGDYTKPYSCVIGCAVISVKEIPEGLVAKTIPASTFMVFHATGEFPKSLIATWNKIWQSNLQRTYSGDYEVYGKKFETESTVEILIAIED